MKMMVMTGFRRPQYIKEVIDSLRKNDVSGYAKIQFGLEPGYPEVARICNEVDFMPREVYVNDKILGVRDNPYRTLERAFVSGAECVVYLEDDVVLSPDTLDLANWYFDLPTRDNHLCLNFYNPTSQPDMNGVFPGKGFSALGIAMSKVQWEKFFKPTWYRDWRGWDHSIISLVNNSQLTNLMPYMSRSHHIGIEGGIHYRAALHDDMYINNPWKQTNEKVQFELRT